jgi:hypothetical protein
MCLGTTAQALGPSAQDIALVQPGGNMYPFCNTRGHVKTLVSPAPNWRGICSTQY